MEEEFNQNLIILDVDGVQANLVDVVEAHVLEKYGKPLNKDVFDLGLSQDEWEEIVTNKHLFESAKPYPGVKEVIDSLKEKGMYIWSITARRVPTSTTILWMKKYNIYFDRLETRSNEERIELVKQERPLLYVDDKFENVYKSCGFVKYPIIVERPWNFLYNPKIIRIQSLSQLMDFLEGSDG